MLLVLRLNIFNLFIEHCEGIRYAIGEVGLVIFIVELILKAQTVVVFSNKMLELMKYV